MIVVTCFVGEDDFFPVGPFGSREEAHEWIADMPSHWRLAAWEVVDPVRAAKSVVATAIDPTKPPYDDESRREAQQQSETPIVGS